MALFGKTKNEKLKITLRRVVLKVCQKKVTSKSNALQLKCLAMGY